MTEAERRAFDVGFTEGKHYERGRAELDQEEGELIARRRGVVLGLTVGSLVLSGVSWFLAKRWGV